jgi:hypothetical protein
LFLKRLKKFCVDETFFFLAILRLRPILPRSKKSNLIAVTYVQRVHNWQRRCCNRYPLSRLYLEKHMRVHRPDGQFHFFVQQTAESRQSWEMLKAPSWESRPGSNWCSMPSTTAIPASSNGLLA